MKDNVFVHVGLTKVASSTLQAFFTAHDSLGYIDPVKTVNTIVENSIFDLDFKETKEFFYSEIELQLRHNKVPIISHERLSGNPHSGHYDAREIAHRLYEIIPRAKILLCIREQMGLMASCYKQYIRIGGIKKLEDYLLPVRDYRVPLFDWRFYEYHHLILLYFNLFGKENVYVMLMEELKRDWESFYENLCAFMGIDSQKNLSLNEVLNPGMPDNEVELKRLTNLFEVKRVSICDPNIFKNLMINRALRNCVRIRFFCKRKKKRKIINEVREFFFDRYRESNLLTEGLISKNLGIYGYELPKGQKNAVT